MRPLHSSILASLACCLLAGAPVATAQSSGGQGFSAASSSIPAATLDKLLAPIALYPDALILQIMQCAQSPYQVHQVNEWVKQNPSLKGVALQEAAQKQGFDVCFVAIVLFPQVLEMMDAQSDWTRQLGAAFNTDRNGVFDSIQRLRKEAQSVGNLQTNAQQTVTTQAAPDGAQVIVIQPTNPQVVYVPQYNPQVVYTQPVVYTAPAETTYGQTVAAGAIGFGLGVLVGAAADNDSNHYYYACGGWGYHGPPPLYRGGWDNYYQTQINVNNNYYNNRLYAQNQSTYNQQNRQNAWQQDQSISTQNQQNRQNAWQQGENDISQNQQNRQNAWQNSGDNWQSQSDRGAAQARGSYQNMSQNDVRPGGMNSGAFSGFQSGDTERDSSARGFNSMSGGSYGGSNGFGGFDRSGGNFGGGGFDRGGFGGGGGRSFGGFGGRR